MNAPVSIHRIAAAGAALTLLCGEPAAFQQQACFTDQIALQPTNWTDAVTIPRFDPDQGILLTIDFSLEGRAEGSAAIENLDASAATISTSFQAEITLTRPDLSVLVVTTPLASFTDDLSAFDGIIDFSGTSGITHSGISATDGASATSPPPASDLALFTGDPGNPGTIDLPVSAMGTSTATGSGNLITQFSTSAGAEVTVCYTFVPDCNGNGIPDDLDVGSGTSNDNNGDGIPDECQPSTGSFCEGDGSQNGGADCPCGNNGMAGEGCDNGSGSGGLLTASGTPSVSNDTLEITASQIPNNAPGFFFLSGQPSNNGDGLPFGHGLVCLDTAVRVRKVDGGGTIPTPEMPPLSVFLGVEAGDTSYFQYWYRNPTGPCPGISANTTNGVVVVWGL